jgi:hypothetical protein
MVLCAYICVYAFSLRRKSSDMILEDKFLICLCTGHGGAGSYDDGLNLELAAAGPFDGPVHGQATSSACCGWVQALTVGLLPFVPHDARNAYKMERRE